MNAYRQLLATLTIATTLLCGGATALAAVIYDAGADLLATEDPDNVNETANPNFVVPEWSYGFRGATGGIALTLFTAADHVNNVSGVLDGFAHTVSLGSGPLPNVFVNTGPAAAFPDGSVATGEITMHPDGTGDNSVEEKSVVRFTASIPGAYIVNALWEDIDDCCSGAGQGVDVHVVLNGVVLTNDFISREGSDLLPNGVTYSDILILQAGDLVDFVVGTNGQLFGDNTRFNATLELIPVPEPSTFCLFGLGLIGAAIKSRRRRPAA